MSYVVAAARVLARAAAIQVEEAAAAAGPVAMQRARHVYHSSAQIDQDQELEHYPQPWPSAPAPAPAAQSEAVRSPRSTSADATQPPLAPPPAQTIPRASHPSSPSRPTPSASNEAASTRDTKQPAPAPAVTLGATTAKPAVVMRLERKELDLTPPPAPSTSTTVNEPTVVVQTITELKAEVEAEVEATVESRLPAINQDPDEAPVALRSSTVPASRLGRLFHYGSLAASLGIGAATESIRRTAGGGGEGSVFMSDANVRRLVATLGRMRGAALKLGQFMSIQDNTILPPEIERVLHQVQAHANYMPDWQMEKAMKAELGPDWESLFGEFDRIPIASASIGQVHRATLPDGTPVAVKIQFPGVAGSINSDLANLSILLRGSAVLPKGLYLQNTIAVMRRELEDECDYIREGAAGKRFHGLLKDDPVFQVPDVVDEASTGKVLTTEWMSGRPLSKMKGMDQETRDLIGTNIMRLCLRELFEFRFMQTDPNWANFMFDASTGKIQLIDFGASRAYTKEFMDGWYRLLSAALSGDRAVMKTESESLGYLTGEEGDLMVNAHIDSMVALANPFRYEGQYPFATQTITDDVRALIPIMLEHRLTPPPSPTYSLNRKLSGAFLMCAKLGANVDCKALWEEVVGGYVEGPVEGEEEEQAMLMAEAHA